MAGFKHATVKVISPSMHQHALECVYVWCVCVLTVPGTCVRWARAPWGAGRVFLLCSLSSFCLFCTSISREMKPFFTSFSKSSSSLRASCWMSSSLKALICLSTSSRASVSAGTVSCLSPGGEREGAYPETSLLYIPSHTHNIKKL